MDRSEIREEAFKLIYAMEIQQDFSEEQINLFFENNEIESEKAREYILDVAKGIAKNKDEITDLIVKFLKEGWTLERISKINLSLLQLAVYEIKYKKISFKIAINEAVEIAKKYGDESSPNFINGLLAGIVEKDVE